ncbi:MAG: FHA domain-containing protein [Gammaproteobacteria bacterium]|nr:FHA domain-containing protein [Gammaproteobacteria bacterium]
MSFKTWFVGRDSSSDVVLNDASVSRNHCEITVSGGECVVVDNRSSSGSFVAVDGKWQRITNRVVPIETVVKLGNVETTIAKLIRGE